MHDKNKQDQIKKLSTFAKHPDLAHFETSNEIADSLKTIAGKKIPDIQKVEIVNTSNDLAATFFSLLKGEKGDEPSDEHLINLITPLIPDPIKGDTGKDSTVPGPKGEDSTVPGPEGKASMIPGPKGDKGDSGDIKDLSSQEIRDSLELLQGEERLSIDAIDGMDKVVADLKGSGKTVNIGGGSRGFQLYVGSVKKGLAQYVSLVAGSNVTITDSIVNGLHTITFSSIGGSGFTKLTATEIPDGSRKTFTFSGASAQPSFLVVDGVWTQPTTATSVVNWTWNNGTKVATLTVPPNDDIYGVV